MMSNDITCIEVLLHFTIYKHHTSRLPQTGLSNVSLILYFALCHVRQMRVPDDLFSTQGSSTAKNIQHHGTLSF